MGILNKEKRFYTKNYSDNLFFPFLVGCAFAFGWTRCICPVLGSILTLAAVETSIFQGIILLSFYSLGLALPFILSGYPHHQEARYFAKLVLPRLKTISLPEARNRIPKETPKTPLGDGPRF